jgi:hypothetical protein
MFISRDNSGPGIGSQVAANLLPKAANFSVCVILVSLASPSTCGFTSDAQVAPTANELVVGIRTDNNLPQLVYASIQHLDLCFFLGDLGSDGAYSRIPILGANIAMITRADGV